MKKIKKENLMLSKNHMQNSGSLSCENVRTSDTTPSIIQGIHFSRMTAFGYAFCKASIKINKKTSSQSSKWSYGISKCQ